MLRFVACLGLVLTLCACRDRDAEALARAELRYRDLVAAGARPEDARFDEVVEALETIDAGSAHAAAAQKLLRGLQRARAGRVRTPLALGANGRRPPELEALLLACSRLAQLAGLDGGVDRRALEALEQCRHQAELMELRYAHGDEHEDGGAHP